MTPKCATGSLAIIGAWSLTCPPEAAGAGLGHPRVGLIRSPSDLALAGRDPATWRLSFTRGRLERLERLDCAYDLSSLSGEVGAVGRGNRSMQLWVLGLRSRRIAVRIRHQCRGMTPNATGARVGCLGSELSAVVLVPAWPTACWPDQQPVRPEKGVTHQSFAAR